LWPWITVDGVAPRARISTSVEEVPTVQQADVVGQAMPRRPVVPSGRASDLQRSPPSEVTRITADPAP